MKTMMNPCPQSLGQGRAHLKLTSRLLFWPLAALAMVAGPCLAQVAPFPPSTTTVTFSAGGPCNGNPAGPPAFTALSVTEKVTAVVSANKGGGQASASTLSFDDIALTRNIDDCSVSLYSLLFKMSHVPSVVISLHNGSNTEVLRLTLTDALVTSMSDAEAVNSAPAERVTLSYVKIVILDPITGKSTTCDTGTRVCG